MLYFSKAFSEDVIWMTRRALIGLVLMFLLPMAAWAEDYQVDQVNVSGNQRVQLSTITAVLSARAGDTVAAETIDRDVKAIFKLGHFSDITAELDQEGDRQVLSYRVVERPLVRRIVFSGNKKLKEEKLRPLVTFRSASIFHPKTLEQSVEAIRNAYIEEGYHGVRIEPRVESGERNEATVHFEITEGQKVLVRDIQLQGNTVFTDKELKKAIQTKEKWWLSWLTDRGTYREEVLQIDLEIIADQYYNKGYVQVKVMQPQITFSDDKEYMDVLIEIEEGEQYRVGEISLQGDLLREKGELFSLFKLKQGDVFSREILRGDVTVLNDLYANQGYAYVNVSPVTRLDHEERLVNILYDIEQGIQVTIDRIRITGNTRTRDKIIRRQMHLLEGDLYNASLIKSSRSKVNNLGFFEEVNVSTSKGKDEAHLDVDVEVKEKPTGTFSIGGGYSSVDGFIAQGSVSQENFLGRALRMNLSASLGGTTTTYQFGLLDPYFLDTDFALGGDVYNTDREYTDFSKKTTGGDIKLGIPLTENTRLFFVYRYEEKEIYDIDPLASIYWQEQAGRSTLSSLFSSFSLNTTDYRPDPTRGHLGEISWEIAGLGGTEYFSKYIADHRVFFPWKWGSVFSLHGQIGYVHKLRSTEEIPIDEKFFLGGINTLRGFATREVGPQDENGDFIGGEKEAFFNAEYTFPLIRDLGFKGLLFFDIGNAWSKDEEYFSSMRYSAGWGIRWNSPMGPLRLEWGYNLDPKEDEDRSRFEFSIGRFF